MFIRDIFCVVMAIADEHPNGVGVRHGVYMLKRSNGKSDKLCKQLRLIDLREKPRTILRFPPVLSKMRPKRRVTCEFGRTFEH